MPEIIAAYPSGRRLRFRGVFRIMPMAGYPAGVPAVLEREDRPGDPSPMVILDPRAVVTSNGFEIYNGSAVQIVTPPPTPAETSRPATRPAGRPRR